METILITGGNGAMASRIIRHFKSQFKFISLDVHEKVSGNLLDLEVLYYKCDICDLNDLIRVKKEIKKNKVKIVSIINSAALDFVPGSTECDYYSSETAMRVINVNVVGAMNVIEIFRSDILENKVNIINVSSIYSKIPPDQSIYKDIIMKTGEQFRKPIYYGLSKAALNYVTKFYVNELSCYGVRVNTLILGGIEANQPDSFKERYNAKIPLGRMANWDDILNAFRFLLSNDSSYVNGVELTIDGGLLCSY